MAEETDKQGEVTEIEEKPIEETIIEETVIEEKPIEETVIEEKVNEQPNVIKPVEVINVTCKGCNSTYDYQIHGKICPACGNVRRGRPPKEFIPTDNKSNNVPPFTKPQTHKIESTKKKEESKVKSLTLDDIANFKPTDFEKSMADMPVMAVHMTLTKHRGYGLTKDEAEEGKKNFSLLIRKYSGFIIEYMPEMICVAWVIKASIMPEMSKAEFDELMRQKNNSNG